MIQNEILAAIKAAQTIIIHRHINPDPDALGSQIGLAEAIRAGYPDKKVYQVGSDTGNLSWLATEETIEDTVYQDALVIVTDTADRPRVSDDRYDQGKQLIKIDHHPNDDAYGDLVWVDESASSASEMIFDLIMASEGALQLSDAAARMLYAGIVGDTGRFMFNNTTPHTLEAAAVLIQKDFDPSQINNQMNTLTLSQARLQGYVFDHLEISPEGAATVVIPRETITQLDLADDQVGAAVGTPGRLANVVAWAEFIEQPEGHYRVRLRSKAPVINALAKAHHGGGHPLASGATATDFAEVIQIQTELAELVKHHAETVGK